MTSPEVRVRVSQSSRERSRHDKCGALGLPFAVREGRKAPKSGRSRNEGIPEGARSLPDSRLGLCHIQTICHWSAVGLTMPSRRRTHPDQSATPLSAPSPARPARQSRKRRGIRPQRGRSPTSPFPLRRRPFIAPSPGQAPRLVYPRVAADLLGFRPVRTLVASLPLLPASW